ncbi:hypothetical protein HOE04_00245, partial [archaeon]|nr:hypothetical protein [archaeon]
YGNCPDKTYCDGDKIKEEKGICSSNTCTYASATILKDCVKERGECVTCEDSEGFGKCVAKPDGTVLSIPEKSIQNILWEDELSKKFEDPFCCSDSGCSGSTCVVPIPGLPTSPFSPPTIPTSFADCNCIDKEEQGQLTQASVENSENLKIKTKSELYPNNNYKSETKFPYGTNFVEYYCENGKAKKKQTPKSFQQTYEELPVPEESLNPIVIEDVADIFDITDPTNHLRSLQREYINDKEFDSTENDLGIIAYKEYLTKTDLTNDLKIHAHTDLATLLQARAMNIDFNPSIHVTGNNLEEPQFTGRTIHRIYLKTELDEAFEEKVTGWSHDKENWFSIESSCIPSEPKFGPVRGYCVNNQFKDPLFKNLILQDNSASALKAYKNLLASPYGSTFTLRFYDGIFIKERPEYATRLSNLQDAIDSFEFVKQNTLDFNKEVEARLSIASTYMKMFRPELTVPELNIITNKVTTQYSAIIGYTPSYEIQSDTYLKMAAFEYHKSFYYPKNTSTIANALKYVQKAIDANSNNKEAKEFQKDMRKMILINIMQGFGVMLEEGSEILNSEVLNPLNVNCWNRDLNDLLDEFVTASDKAEETKGALALLVSLQTHENIDIKSFARDTKRDERYKIIGKLKRFQPVINDNELTEWLIKKQSNDDLYNNQPIIANDIMTLPENIYLKEILRMEMTEEEVPEKRANQYKENLELIHQYDALLEKAFCLPDVALMLGNGERTEANLVKIQYGCNAEIADTNQNKDYFLFKTGELYEYQTVTDDWSDFAINFITPVDVAMMATPLVVVTIAGKTSKFLKLTKLSRLTKLSKFSKLTKLFKSADNVEDAMKAAKITTMGSELDTAVEVALRSGISRTYSHPIGTYTSTTFVQGMSEEIAFQLVGNVLKIIPGPTGDIGQIIAMVGAGPGLPNLRPKQKWIFFDANQKPLLGLELKNNVDVKKYLDGMEAKGVTRDGNKLNMEGADYMVYSKDNALDSFNTANIRYATESSRLKEALSNSARAKHVTPRTLNKYRNDIVLRAMLKKFEDKGSLNLALKQSIKSEIERVRAVHGDKETLQFLIDTTYRKEDPISLFSPGYEQLKNIESRRYLPDFTDFNGREEVKRALDELQENLAIRAPWNEGIEKMMNIVQRTVKKNKISNSELIEGLSYVLSRNKDLIDSLEIYSNFLVENDKAFRTFLRTRGLENEEIIFLLRDIEPVGTMYIARNNPQNLNADFKWLSRKNTRTDLEIAKNKDVIKDIDSLIIYGKTLPSIRLEALETLQIRTFITDPVLRERAYLEEFKKTLEKLLYEEDDKTLDALKNQLNSNLRFLNQLNGWKVEPLTDLDIAELRHSLPKIYAEQNLENKAYVFVDNGYQGSFPTLLSAMHEIETSRIVGNNGIGKKSPIYLTGAMDTVMDYIPHSDIPDAGHYMDAFEHGLSKSIDTIETTPTGYKIKNQPYVGKDFFSGLEQEAVIIGGVLAPAQ